jgi:hypothetical protein
LIIYVLLFFGPFLSWHSHKDLIDHRGLKDGQKSIKEAQWVGIFNCIHRPGASLGQQTYIEAGIFTEVTNHSGGCEREKGREKENLCKQNTHIRIV